MVKTASLNAAPKNHVCKAGVNRHGAFVGYVLKLFGIAKPLTLGVAVSLTILVSHAHTVSAQSTTGVIVGDGTGSGAIRTCDVGQDTETDNRPCISNNSINQAIDDRIQAAGAAHHGADTVGSSQIINNSVTSADIQDGSVTGTDIADGSVTGTDIQDGSITQNELSDNSVGSDQIIDQSVTQADLSDNSVGSVQIIDNSVTSNDIANGTIQNEDLAESSANSHTIENDSILLEDLNGEVRQFIDNSNSNTLTQANAYTDRRVNELQQQVDRNADIANDGIAMALAAQVPTLSEGTVQAVTMGYGYYSGSSAFSIGGTARIENTNWQVFGTLGYGFRAEKIGLSMGLLWSR